MALLTLLPADVAPSTAVREIAELGNIDVYQRAGVLVFVAAQRFPGHPVDTRKPIDPTAHQHRMHRRGRHPQATGDLDRAEPMPPAQPHDLLGGPGRATMRPAAAVMHPGLTFGAAAISPLPGSPGRGQNIFAAWAGRGPAQQTSRASRNAACAGAVVGNRCAGAAAALAVNEPPAAVRDVVHLEPARSIDNHSWDIAAANHPYTNRDTAYRVTHQVARPATISTSSRAIQHPMPPFYVNSNEIAQGNPPDT